MAAAAQNQQQVNVPALLARVAKLEAENKALKAEMFRMNQAQRWREKLEANSEVPSQQKLTLVHSLREWEKHRDDVGVSLPEPDQEPELVPVFMDDIAKRCGVNRKTVGETVKQLSQIGALRRVEYRDKGPGGIPITRVKLALTRAALDHPEQLIWEKKRGGKRVCKACGSDRIRVQQITIEVCESCGNRSETASAEHYANAEMETPPNDALEPQQDLAQQQQEERATQDAEDAPEPVQDATEAFTLSIPLGEDVDISNPPYSILSSITLDTPVDPFDEGGPTYTDPFTSDDDTDDDDDGEEGEAW